jgi:hypothetical protein
MSKDLKPSSKLCIDGKNISIDDPVYFIAEIGSNFDQDLERAKALIASGVDLIVIDTAHGHSEKVLKILSKIKKINLKKPICVGNIATAEAALKLYNEGADILKVGIGPGSICTTRMIAGIGVPQISAILDVKKTIKNVENKLSDLKSRKEEAEEDCRRQ